MLQHEASRVPVTALAFSERYLFAGQGPFLKVHRKDDAKFLDVCQVFPSQAIHGITVSGSTIIVWGGYFISVYHCLPSGSKSVLDSNPITLKAQDWILDVSISPYSLDRPLATALTAHNALLLLDLDPTSGARPELTDLTSTSRCILYSANLYWLDPTHVLVASGTVFGEIILWSCNIEDRAAPSSVLHQLLSGHDGSIFGVRMLEAPLKGTEKRPSPLLASCSDDRTIRIWDISDLPETPFNPETAADMSSARETGFGSNVADALPDHATSGRCVAKGWGHASRIWDIRFLPLRQVEPHTMFVSFGEDATALLWILAPPTSSKGPRVLTQLAKNHNHAGKNIWSSAVTVNDRADVVVATGGADGSISLASHSRPFASVSDSIQSWTVDVISSASPVKRPGKSDKLRGYAFVTRNSLIVSTDSGNVFLLESASGRNSLYDPELSCQWISQECKLQGYSVVASLSALAIAFLAGMDGTILIFDANSPSSIRELVLCSGKTALLIARPLSLPGRPGIHACLLVANVESKTATLLHLSSGPDGFRVVAKWIVKLPDGFIVTSFLFTPSNDGGTGPFSLILGSRNGAVATYDVALSRLSEEQVPIPYRTVVEGLHGKDAVTDLAFVNSKSTGGIAGHIFSVGRDGTFVVLKFTSDPTTDALQLVNRTGLPLGTLIEGLSVRETDNTVCCWGFYSKQFIVIDLIKERQTMTVDCGGANRTWRYEPSPSSSSGVFAWTRASQLCLTTMKQIPPQIYGGGGHGREIKSIAVRQSSSCGVLHDTQIIATGSEDTDIKLFVYEPSAKGQTTFPCLRTLRKHNTGIQNLQWSSDGQFLFSSGGFEEFFVWRLQPCPLFGVGVVCESVCPTESDLPDLRIMHFSARQAVQDRGSNTAPVFIISMVRSDSTLRVYMYTSSSNGGLWHLLSGGNYLTSCFTQCLDVSHVHGRTLVTVGTDGHIALWPLHGLALGMSRARSDVDPVSLHWTSRHKAHQSAIHCLLVHWIEKDKDCLLMTGGDDNAFALTRCTWDVGNGSSPKMATLRVPRAHAAAITGLEIVSTFDPWSVTIATTSLDQQLKTWDLRLDSTKVGVEGISVIKGTKEFTPVADVSGMALLDPQSEESAIIICGVGMDVWRYRPAVNKT